MGWSPPTKVIDDISGENISDPRAAPSFSVSAPDTLSFKWEDLILCVGRTQMLGTARSRLTVEERSRLVHDVSVAILTHLDIFIDTSSTRLAFTSVLDEVADEERTSLASKAGAAVADLFMERAGYRFRANARELDFSKIAKSTSRKIPDFVYDDPKDSHSSQSRAIVVEAKGSLSKFLATKGRLIARAKKAYEEQISEFVGGTANGITISGGCAAAFGGLPGQTFSRLVICSSDVTVGDPKSAQETREPAGGGSLGAVARSLSAAASPMQPMPQPQVQQRHQEQVSHPNPGGDGGGRHGHGRGREREPGPNGRIAFANYETIFQLCGATDAAQAIRYSLAGAIPRDESPQVQLFMTSTTDDRFLFSRHPYAPCWAPGYFAVYRPMAEAILQSLANNRLAPPNSVRLPEVPTDLTGRDELIFVHEDGLAWVKDLKGDLELRKWNLATGGWWPN
jgi:hypothetical protein